MLEVMSNLKPDDLRKKIERFWNLSGKKIDMIDKNYDTRKGSPVFTVEGQYTTIGWTEWTQGFQYGSEILQYEGSGDQRFLDMGKKNTLENMAPHVSHTGVHDHGFNNVSTYGNLLRLMVEKKIAYDEWEKNFYQLALKLSGAVQANRWTETVNGGFICSFNCPHSLFVDTIRSCRALVLGHMMGHYLPGENDIRISLLHRAVQHLISTAKYSVYYGDGRDVYDVRGRTAHECIFNVTDGVYRCPNSQQGYTGFSTWTRGLAWAMLGFAEQLEFFQIIEGDELTEFGGKNTSVDLMLKAAEATCDFYIENVCTNGIPYWDTGAPNLHKMGDYLDQEADPYNDFEPVDSSAAAIGAQGLMRLGQYLKQNDNTIRGDHYFQAGLSVVNRLLEEPYLSTNPNHQGLLLHTIYHRPNGWDHIPEGSKIPNGESCMWGDYHIRELVLYVQRMINNDTYFTFFNCLK